MSIQPKAFASCSVYSPAPEFSGGRRCLDVAIALAAIMLLAPVLVLIALAIALDSRGPLLLRQHGGARSGRGFQIHKFRSMHVLGHARVTRVGRILRALSLDELPQLFNVLAGDMSLASPRLQVTARHA